LFIASQPGWVLGEAWVRQGESAKRLETLNLYSRIGRGVVRGAIFGYFAIAVATASAQSVRSKQSTNEIRIVELEGEVEVSPAGAITWVLTQTNQLLHPMDRLRTGPKSRVALRWSDQSVVPFGASTELQVLKPDASDNQPGIYLVRGIISFFHRDKPGRIRIITRGAVAGVEGTEFVLAANDAGLTTLSVVDGRVQFTNELGGIVLTNGQQATAESGQAPARTAGFIANNLLQWSFYYPAVLDLADLPLSAEEENVLGKSLAAYRSGDLLAALRNYPAARQPDSDAERIYYAALLLSVGEVEQAQSALGALSANATDRFQRLAAALHRLIAAVKRQTISTPIEPQFATEFLANSYYEQSLAIRETSLRNARASAQKAVERSPQFGFGWARLAELEFSFGRTDAALNALDKSLSLTPRNAQALALKGFLFAAQNRTREAIAWFDRALEVDSALGNAWLGRGIARIRRGDLAGGREDLLVAAALEPQRAELRSYLAKAFAVSGDFPRATRELELAKRLDWNDPTPWFYSALLNQEHSRINEAIGDLEKSQELNDNRSVYRSQLLLDQDRAVRGANLAAMYRDAGMTDVSVREAVRAVNYDYANFSAHLFLANSYSELRDPNLINLRYETAAASEFLVANLLAPVSAGVIAPVVSRNEYANLFERNRLGVVSSTEYLSRGAWTQSGAQYGVYGNFNYALEAFYRTDPGERLNQDVEQRQLSLSVKQQITPADTVYLQVQQYEGTSGDVFQYYDPAMASRTARTEEKQEPVAILGYHHEWSPGVHTLFLAARVDDTLSFTNRTQPTLIAFREGDDPSPLVLLQPVNMSEHYEDKLELYSGELQQIWEQPAHTTIVGGRAQYGHFRTKSVQSQPLDFGALFPQPVTNAADQNLATDFYRLSIYGYHQWQVLECLQLVGGLAYDWMKFPENTRYAPISAAEKTEDQISPKAGLIWTPMKDSILRVAYTRSLAGPTLDQSYRLEPSQVAGFLQSYRSIIPESVVGANAGAEFETFGISWEQKFCTGTYLGLSGELLNSKVDRTVGAFDIFDTPVFGVPSGVRERLDYKEQSLMFTANQLIGKEWSLGVRYRVSKAVLHDNFVDTPPSDFRSVQRTESVLHQVNLFTIYNHPSGFFATPEAVWYAQNNLGYTPARPGDDFWQLNAFVGYRFPRRKAQAMIGVLNITDKDYRLNPLNVYNEAPRERTLAVRFQLNF
jgi:Flp pilus assembly protein TadD